MFRHLNINATKSFNGYAKGNIQVNGKKGEKLIKFMIVQKSVHTLHIDLQVVQAVSSTLNGFLSSIYDF